VAATKGAGPRTGAGEEVDVGGQVPRRGRRHGHREQQRHREDRSRGPADVVLEVVRNVPAPMHRRNSTLAALAATVAVLVLALIFGGSDSKQGEADAAAVPGQPSVEIVSPRNGARQTSHAVVVKAIVRNFRLAPLQFGRDPRLGEGHIRFSLNRVPDCVDPVKLLHAINSPIGNGRLVGASFDYPPYSGPNGVLAERIGSAGSYSPSTRPEIFYHGLPPGFYRLILNLAQNNGTTTPVHAVTNFQILPRPGHGPKPCAGGKVPSAKAAARLNG
jgi:hypothetical protein